MKSIYLETSALLRVIFSQNESEKIIVQMQKANHIITSRLTLVETERAIIRLTLDHPAIDKKRSDLERDLRQIFARVDFVEIDQKVCDLATRISPKSRIRSLDAIHLSTYQILRQHDPAIEMLTCDDKIRQAL